MLFLFLFAPAVFDMNTLVRECPFALTHCFLKTSFCCRNLLLAQDNDICAHGLRDGANHIRVCVASMYRCVHSILQAALQSVFVTSCIRFALSPSRFALPTTILLAWTIPLALCTGLIALCKIDIVCPTGISRATTLTMT